MKKVIEASLVSGSKENEGDGKNSEADASHNKDERKDTSEEALCSTLDVQLRKKQRKLSMEEEKTVVKDITRLFKNKAIKTFENI